MKPSSLIGVASLLFLFATCAAQAHALLERAEPRVGNKIAAPPREVTLWFTQKLEPAFSNVTVTNATGERIDTGKARVSGNQIWRVLSVDTHTTNGNFTFQVGQ